MTNIFMGAFCVFILAGLTMLIVSGRLSDALYLVQTHFKATLFIVICLAVGALAGVNIRNFDSAVPSVDLAAINVPAIGTLYQTSEEKTLATIRNCQAFVTAQIDTPPRAEHASLPERTDGSSPLLHLASDVLPGTSPGTSKDWDRCARAFGTNYWKTDISVKGENGGVALCRAYHAQTGYRSPRVETWCNTVFKVEQMPKSP